AATNRDLDQGISDGTFRSDLYYRLNVVSVVLPSLRDRRDDIPPLIRHFLQAKASELGISEKQFSNDALDMLMQYAWPGNVRELENAIERALVLSHGSTMTRADLPQYLDAVNARPHPVQQCVLRGETRLSEAVDQ